MLFKQQAYFSNFLKQHVVFVILRLYLFVNTVNKKQTISVFHNLHF